MKSYNHKISISGFIGILVLALSSVAFAKTFEIDEVKDKFEAAAWAGCVEKQLSTELGQATKESVIDDSCTCFSRIYVDELFDDDNFTKALNPSMGSAKVRALAEEAVPDQRLVEISNFCARKALNHHDGSPNKLLKEEFDSEQLSDKPGLQGAARDAFVASAMSSCLAGDTTAEMKQFCSCTIDKMADRLSDRQVVSLMNGDRGKAAEVIINLQIEMGALCEAEN